MKKILSFLDMFEKVMITLFMSIMVVLIFTQVFTRFVLNDAATWTEEASRYLFIWLIFLSIGVAFVEKKHISIDIVMDRLPKVAQVVLQQIVYIMLIGLSVFFLMQGIELVDNMMTFNQKSSILQVPMWAVYASLPVGFLFAVLRLIQASIRLYVTDEEEKEGSETL